MARALDFLHGSTAGLVYQTLFFSEHVKFQYPPSALLLLDLLRRMGIGTTFQYNAANAGISNRHRFDILDLRRPDTWTGSLLWIARAGRTGGLLDRCPILSE